MLKSLGCNFTNSLETMVTKFKHSTRDYYVYCTLDACHMIKLARNALGDLGCFKSAYGKFIEWQFIKNLIELQIEKGFNIANKLNSDHLNWQRQKMKVKLATQTFSSSTAAALQFLQQKIKHEKFINCTDTIVFVRNIDRLFDFLNSRHPASSGFKSPIRLSNFEKKKAMILEICNYLLSLKDPDIYALSQHRRKTFIIGFVSFAKSILSIAEKLLFRSDNPYKYLLTYKLSQDHL